MIKPFQGAAFAVEDVAMGGVQCQADALIEPECVAGSDLGDDLGLPGEFAMDQRQCAELFDQSDNDA